MIRLQFLAPALLGVCLLVAGSAPAATAKPPKPPAAPELSAVELDRVADLFAQLREAFLAGDALDVAALVSERAPEREQTVRNVRREFKQGRYINFEIKSILPDDSLGQNQHSVQVALGYTLIPTDTSRTAQGPIEDSTNHTFVVEKQADGSFRLMSSSFFASLGRRHGLSLLVDGLLLIMGSCVALAFWVWMGFEAFRLRPRRTLWRTLTMVPVAGALVFFVVVYLPRQFTR